MKTTNNYEAPVAEMIEMNMPVVLTGSTGSGVGGGSGSGGLGGGGGIGGGGGTGGLS